jgi:hypothetical protein
MTDPAETQLESFIVKFEPEVAAVARAARAVMRRRFPTALELVYDNYNFLAVGYAASERASDCIVSLAVGPRGVALSFYYGASVPDPTGRLLGSGNQNRFVRLDSAETLMEPVVEALIAAAAAQAKTPLPADSGGQRRTAGHQVSLRQTAAAPA